MPCYHTHVTVKPEQGMTVPKGWKRTEIILQGDRVQTDVMFTKYYSFEGNDVSKVTNKVHEDVHDKRFPFDRVMRVKIEQTNDFFLPVDEIHYVEIHLLVTEDTRIDSANWVKSRNPKTVKNGKHCFFLNRRIYKASSFEAAMSIVKEELKGVDYIDLKAEQVVFDSNREIDKWWA